MINHIAVIVAAIVAFGIGGLWYSPLLFGKQWMKLSGMDGMSKKEMTQLKEGARRGYLGSLITGIIQAGVLAYFLSMLAVVGFVNGAIVGFWVWLGFQATQMIGGVFWKNESITLYLLNTAHALVVLIVMGGVLGAWV